MTLVLYSIILYSTNVKEVIKMPKTLEQKAAIKTIETAEVAMFTTINALGFPETRAMLNLRNSQYFPKLVDFFRKSSEDFLIYFTTNTASEKVKQIKANKKVAVYYCNAQEWQGIMLAGQIEIITDYQVKASIWQDEWVKYYTQGVDDPDYSLLRLWPEKIKYYSQLKVQNWNLSRGEN